MELWIFFFSPIMPSSRNRASSFFLSFQTATKWLQETCCGAIAPRILSWIGELEPWFYFIFIQAQNPNFVANLSINVLLSSYPCRPLTGIKPIFNRSLFSSRENHKTHTPNKKKNLTNPFAICFSKRQRTSKLVISLRRHSDKEPRLVPPFHSQHSLEPNVITEISGISLWNLGLPSNLPSG